MKSFIQEKSRYLSPDPRVYAANPSVFSDFSTSNPASNVAMTSINDKTTRNIIQKCILSNDINNSSNNKKTNNSNKHNNNNDTDNDNGNNLHPQTRSNDCYKAISELEFEKLKKTDLSYLTLFRKSSHFSNKGFTHFFLSQELKPEDSPYSFDHNISNNNSNIPIGQTTSLNNSYTDISNGNTSTITSVDSHAIYNLSFSHDGKYLASAGADGLIRIWEVITSEIDRNNMNINTSSDSDGNNSTTNDSNNFPHGQHRKSFLENTFDETLNDLSSLIDPNPGSFSRKRKNTRASLESSISGNSNNNLYRTNSNIQKSHVFAPVFKSKPIKTFYHDKTINSLDWSKNNFLLSSSEDGTAKLWHVDRADCLQTYKFDSIVTCAKFHKSDDRFFVASEWNGRIVFVSILEKTVVYQLDLRKSITCFNFSPDSTKLFVGCDKGYIFVVKINGGLEIETDYQIKRKNNTPRITGITPFLDDSISYDKGNNNTNNKLNDSKGIPLKILVSCNDSKIRLFNFSNKCLEVRYSGYVNRSSSIGANVNEDHTHIITGSDDGWCYLWQIYSDKKNRIENEKKPLNKAHFDILNYFKDDTCLINNKYYGSFHSHNNRCNVALFAPRASSKLLELSNDPIFELKHQFNFALEESHIKDLEVDDLSTSIIITTDNTGKIKIFRRDFSHYIRKALQGKKATQILEKNQYGLKHDLNKKVLNKNSLVIPNYEATTTNIADTMSSVYSEADTLRGRGKNGYVRPANKFFVESSITPGLESSLGSQRVKPDIIPLIKVESPASGYNDGSNYNAHMTKDKLPNSIDGEVSFLQDENNGTLKNIPYDSKSSDSTYFDQSTPVNQAQLFSESNSSSSRNSIAVSDSVKNIDDELRRMIVGSPNLGVVHEVGQLQHSQSRSPYPRGHADVYIKKELNTIGPDGVQESQIQSVPLNMEENINGRVEGWSKKGKGTFTCPRCQCVNFTPKPMNSGDTNKIRFYCDDCGKESRFH